MKISTRTAGLICGALAAGAYGLNPLFALPLYKLGMTPDQVLLCRFALAAVMLVPVMLCKKITFAINLKETVSLFAGGMLMATSALTLYLAYQCMDAGLASTVLFVYPVIVAVTMCTVFRERISLVTVISIVLSLAGLSLLANGGSGSKVTLAGVLLSLASAASYAFYIVAVKKSAMKNLSSTKLTFYTLVFGSLLYLLRLDCGASMRVPCDWFAWLCLVGVAFFPTIIALAFMAISIAKAGATPTAILGVLEPVTGLMVGVLIFGERLNLLNIAGIILIFVSVLLIVCPGDKNSSQEPAE